MDRKAGVLWSMGSQRVGRDWVTEPNWTELYRLWRCLAEMRSIALFESSTCAWSFSCLSTSCATFLQPTLKGLPSFLPPGCDCSSVQLSLQPELCQRTLGMHSCPQWILCSTEAGIDPSLCHFSLCFIHWPCFCCCLATKLCLTLCDPVDCSPSGSSVHGLLSWQ